MLVNTIVSGQTDYNVADRWVLSRDRSTLRVERRVVRRNGESEGALVYRREGTMLTNARPPAAPAPELRTLSQRPPAPAVSEFIINPGTRIPLALMNSLSAKRARDGDRVYLETVFPVSAAGRVVIPRGSYVAGTVTQAKSSGRVSGKAELYIRFDTLTLPNGVTRDFLGRVSNSDARGGTVDRQEGKITAESDKGKDARKVAEGTAMGASIGSIAGAISHHPGFGLGAGAAAGAAAGLASVLTSRGSDVILPKGTTLEMVLDRELRFQPEELRF
jgi:type IV secretion system protein VirB10